MFSIYKVNEHLKNHPDDIVKLLEELGLENISFNERRHNIRCSREPGRNPSSVSIDTDTLFYKCFSTGNKGSIVSLVMDQRSVDFRSALDWIGLKLGLPGSENLEDLSIKLPFGGFYKSILKDHNQIESHLKTLPEDILSSYSDIKTNMLFYKDGIDFTSQVSFGLGYDIESGRITIPQRDIYGNLIGIMGRMNSSVCDYSERWLPIIPCPRSLTLFGYSNNIRSIEQGGGCVLVESEKSVMQMDTMGFKFGLATCTNAISDAQAKIIKGHNASINNVVIAFDEGLEESLLQEAANKLRIKNKIYDYKVGYIYDKEHELMPKGSKCSPTDLGKEIFTKLLKEKVVWIGDDEQ